jgi:peptidoglycan/LPS O-acetylase OafA/YrhL
MEYRREIDGLRALAVIAVILFHAGFLIFRGGFIGVDIFFVISGYLITSIIVEEISQEKFSLKIFYERRIRRLFPAFFFVITITTVIAWFWMLPDYMKSFSASLVASTLFVSNFLFLRESGYFDTAAELKPLLHTWSLGVEEQFYLLFPVFLILFCRLGKRWVVFSMALVFAFSFIFSVWATYEAPSAAFFLLPTRAWELLAGAFTALYLKEKRAKETGRVIGEIGSISGVFLIVFSLVLFDKDTPIPGLLALIPVLGTVLIVLFAQQNNFVGRILGNRILVGIGLMSYSAYLWHHPLFSLATHRRLEIPSTTSSLVLFVVTLILGYLTWRFVELPFRKRDKINQATVFTLATTLSFAVVIFGSYGFTSNGFSNRFEKILSGDTAHLQFHTYIDQNFYDCEPSSIARSALGWDGFLRCKQSKPGVPDIVILGDSHAEHLFIGVAENLPDLNAAFYIQSGGPFIDNPQFKEIFGELLSNNEKQHIILTMYLSKRSIDSNELYSGFAKTINATANSITRRSALANSRVS